MSFQPSVLRYVIAQWKKLCVCIYMYLGSVPISSNILPVMNPGREDPTHIVWSSSVFSLEEHVLNLSGDNEDIWCLLFKKVLF